MNIPKLINNTIQNTIQKRDQKKIRTWLCYFYLIVSGLVYLQNVNAEVSDHKTLLILGDSLSAGYGIPLDSSWVELLRNDLEEKRYKIVNASISGETTDGGLRALPQLLDQHRPEITLIELGANDGLRGFPLPTIKNNLSELINQSLQYDSQVLLIGMHIPPNYGNRYAQGFHQIFHELSQQYDIPLLPFLLEDVAIHDNLMQEDRLHPNAKAQPIIKNHVKKALEGFM